MKKYKLKTKKSAQKRIKVTSKGKLKRNAVGRRHLLEHVSSKTKRLKRNEQDVSKADEKNIRSLLNH